MPRPKPKTTVNDWLFAMAVALWFCLKQYGLDLQPEVLAIFAATFLLLSLIRIISDKRAARDIVLGCAIAILSAIVLLICILINST